MFDYLLGLDFGSITDHTALVLAARAENPGAHNEGEPLHVYELVHTEQLPLGINYPDIISYVDSFVKQKEISGRVQVAADCTGVGVAVLDLLRSNPSLSDITWSIVFTSGQGVTQKGMVFKVPKKDLIASVLILSGRGLLTCNNKMPQAETLRKEMLGYIMKKSTAGNLKFDAMSRMHDDMVVALCMVCWIGERIPIDLAMSSGEGGYGALSPGQVLPANPLITSVSGQGVNLGFARPPR